MIVQNSREYNGDFISILKQDIKIGDNECSFDGRYLCGFANPLKDLIPTNALALILGRN
jgi:hypothetical protein